MVSATVPPAVSVTDFVEGVFTFTLPKGTLDALTLKVEVAPPKERTYVLDTPLSVAVRVAVCADDTAETVAVKPALVSPASTVTEAGTLTAESLLVRLIVAPPLAAAAFSETVHESLPAPVIDELVHDNALGVGIPVPVRLTVAFTAEAAPVAIVSVPAAAPAAVGSNFTCSVAVWLGFSVVGGVPDRVKPAPLTVTESIVSATAPVEVNVTDCVDAVFTFTFPNVNAPVLRRSP
jgi:hypothetical protein